MKKLWDTYGISWLFVLLPCIAALLTFPEIISGVVLPIGLLTGILILWSLILLLADRLSPVAAPILILIFAGLLMIRLFDGIHVFVDVLYFWGDHPGETWVAADFFVMLVLGALSILLLYLSKFFYTRLVLAAALSGLWIYAAIRQIPAPKAAVIFIVPLILFEVIEILHRIRGEEQEKGAWMGIVCLLCLLLFVLPVSSEPYPYKWLHRAWDGVEELWKKIDTQIHYRKTGGTEFTVEMNGPGDKGNVSGTKEDEALHELRVWSDFGDESVIYLPGAALDYFDGREWGRAIPEEEAGELLNWNMDSAEHIYAMWRLNQASDEEFNAEIYYRRRRLDITYNEMDTRTLFTTPGTLRIYADEDRFPYQPLAGRVQFDYVQEKDSAYTLYYLEENTENLPELIRASEGYTYDETLSQSWGQISGTYAEQFLLTMIQTTQMESSLSERDRLIETYYLQIPEDLPDEIIQLAHQITVGCESDYDRLKAIEAYLHDNFEYTLNPEPPERGEDFLSHMMEVKEGDCTWFATAATILSRACGIPARYVQGYRTVIPRQTRVLLLDEDVHAWCEGYIQGYGWVIIEATPGYSSAILSWEIPEGSDDQLLPEETGEGEGVGSEEAMEEKTASPLGIGIAIAAVLLLLGGAGTAVWIVYRRKKQYQAMSYSERLEPDLKLLLKRMARQGWVRYPYESLRTFFKRVYWQGMAVNPEDAREVCRIYEDAFFGGIEITEEEWSKERELVDKLRKKYKK